MAGLPITNWIRFIVWLIIGLVVYYFYGRRHSELAVELSDSPSPRGEKR